MGDLGESSINEIRSKLKETKLIISASKVDKRCLEAKCFEYCRGGDRFNGVVFTGKPADPYCDNLL